MVDFFDRVDAVMLALSTTDLLSNKHVAFRSDWNSKIHEGVPEVNHLICSNSCCHQLRAKSCSFYCSFSFGVSTGWGCIYKVTEFQQKVMFLSLTLMDDGQTNSPNVTPSG